MVPAAETIPELDRRADARHRDLSDELTSVRQGHGGLQANEGDRMHRSDGDADSPKTQHDQLTLYRSAASHGDISTEEQRGMAQAYLAYTVPRSGHRAPDSLEATRRPFSA